MIWSDGRVLDSSRRLRLVQLLVGLLACSWVALTPHAAHADTQKDADRADLVFTGEVVEVLDADKKATYSIKADLIWKGILTKTDVEVVAASRKCPLNLKRNQTYVFFVTLVGGDRVSSECAGTTVTSDDLEVRLDELLGTAQAIDRPETPRDPAVFTPVAGAEPASFTRLATPGAVLVLIGLFGLAVVGLISRRR